MTTLLVWFGLLAPPAAIVGLGLRWGWRTGQLLGGALGSFFLGFWILLFLIGAQKYGIVTRVGPDFILASVAVYAFCIRRALR